MPVIYNKRNPYPRDAIYVGRPTRWGNPFSHLEGTTAQYRVATREEAVEKYREYLLSNSKLLKSLPELKGKDLVCWCAPASCHGEILLELANQS